MFILYFLEWAIAFGLLALIATQILIPSFTGGRYFPLFRRKDIHDERVAAEEELERAVQQEAIDDLKRQTEEVKHHHREKPDNESI